MYKFRTNTSNNSHPKRKQKAKKKKYSKSKSKNENDIAKVETASVIPQNAIPNDVHTLLKTNNPMPCIQVNQNFSHVIYFDAGFYFCNSFLMLNETFSRNERTPHKKQSRKTKSSLNPPPPPPIEEPLAVIEIETESNNLVNVPLSLSNLVETKSEFNSIAFLYKNDLFNDNSLFILSNCLFYFNVKEAKNYETKITLSNKLPFDFYSVNNEKNIYYFDYSNQPDASYRLINEFDLFFRHACNINILKLIRDNEMYNCLNVFSNQSILIKLLLHLYLNEIIKTKYSFAIQNSQSMLEYAKIDESFFSKIEHEHPQNKPSFTSPLKSNKRSKSSIYLGNRKKVKLDKRFKSSICLFERPNQVDLFELNSSSTSFSGSFSVNKNEQDLERKELDSLEHIEIETSPNLNRKARPSYIIERDCHVFGGCMDDDALDEFFISSGAVYQSWPYVYEPGFQLVPLFDIVDLPMSRSATQINSYDQNNSCNNRVKNDYSNNYNESQDELPSYSINNFEINMLHIDNKKKKKSKKKKLKKPVTCNSIESASIVENSSSFASFLSSSNESSYSYTDESSDDSESIIEYKKRHAIGLNFNSHFNKVAKCNSHLNLSNNKNDSGFLYKKTRVENENHRKSSCESLKICQRLATSAYYKKSSSKKSKRIRFLSQKRVDFNYHDREYVTNYVSQNFIF